MTHALYAGLVRHARLRPIEHNLAYRVFMGLFDLDGLPGARGNWAFGYNRPGLIAFYDRDHGDGSGAALRPQIEAKLKEIGIDLDGGAIRVLCMPRVLGYVFNPLSAYYCYDRGDRLAAIVHEVNNTFGERHVYALGATVPPSGTTIVQRCAKTFRVSPFLPMDLNYTFRVTQPSERTALTIVVEDERGAVLTASFHGDKRPFTVASILRLWLAHPLLTFRVIAGIHWEALWIWLGLRKVNRHRQALAD